MSNSPTNPFASPSPPAKGFDDSSDRKPIELRTVSFSGKLSEEEAHLLSGRKTIELADSILLLPVVFAICAAIFQLRTYGFRAPDSSMWMIFLAVLSYALFLWSISKKRHKHYWQSETTQGTINQNEIFVRFESSEINLVLSEHKTHIETQGIRIEIGKSGLRRSIQISRNWFLPGEFEIACEAIRQSKEIELRSLQLSPVLSETPTLSVAIYQLSEKQRISLLFTQIFSSWSCLMAGLAFLLLGLFIFALERQSTARCQ